MDCCIYDRDDQCFYDCPNCVRYMPKEESSEDEYMEDEDGE